MLVPFDEESSVISARNLRDKDLINLVPNEVPDVFADCSLPMPLSVIVKIKSVFCLVRADGDFR
jgi:hypothetical protein